MNEFLSSWGYLAILVFTFLEGETIVILAGIAAYQGMMDVWLVFASALTGSFCGDQLYYYIGRRWGTWLLDKFPTVRMKIDWAFRLLRKYETIFILSFRFIYGVRNVSPFAIGMSGIPRIRFALLNFIAAMIWAAAFTFGGYFFGHAIETLLGEYQHSVLIVLACLAAAGAIWSLARSRRKNRELRAKQEAEKAALAAQPDPAPSE